MIFFGFSDSLFPPALLPLLSLLAHERNRLVTVSGNLSLPQASEQPTCCVITKAFIPITVVL